VQPTGGDQREAAAPVERHARWGNAALLLTSLLASLLVIETLFGWVSSAHAACDVLARQA